MKERLDVITPKVKKMADFAIKKLEMKTSDMAEIKKLKRRQQSIDEIEFKKIW